MHIQVLKYVIFEQQLCIVIFPVHFVLMSTPTELTPDKNSI